MDDGKNNSKIEGFAVLVTLLEKQEFCKIWRHYNLILTVLIFIMFTLFMVANTSQVVFRNSTK